MVICQGMFLADVSYDPQGGWQGLPRHWSSVGSVEGHNRYYQPAADRSKHVPRHTPWLPYGTWYGDRHPQG